MTVSNLGGIGDEACNQHRSKSLLPFDPPGFGAANLSQFFSGTIAKEFSNVLKCHPVCEHSEEWGLGLCCIVTARELVYTASDNPRVDGIT
jgi:hypothetical protein